MTFPVVASVSTQNGLSVSSGSDISVTLPSGVTSGDLVVVVVAVDGGSSTSVAFGTLSNGWAKTTNEATSGVAGGVFWKYADGTDALDIPFTASGSEIFSYVAYRITGAHGTTDPEIVNLGSSSTSANPDPPNLSLSGWSTEDTLWMAASTHDHGQWFVSTWPTNYSSNQYTARNNLTTGATTAVATRELAASSENPNAFTITASDTWIAWTIAVRPAAGGGSATVTLTGISATSAAGNTAADITTALTGVPATAATGTVGATTGATAALTGVNATTATGTLTAATSAALTGISSTAAAGSTAASISTALTGVSSTAATGTLSAGGDVAVSITGQAASTAQGTVGVTASGSAALTGASSTAATGTLTAGISKALTGASATVSAGSLVAGGDVSVTITGQAVSTAQGTIGVTATGAVTVALTGAAAVIAAGNIFVIAPVIGWTPVDDSISNAWIPVDDSNAALWA